MEAAELKKKIEKYDRLAQKNYEYYQQSGEPRYDKAYENYEELADVYRAAYKYQSEHDESLSRRLKNISYYIEEHIKQIPKETYTKKEVLELAEKFKQFVY